MPRTLIIASIFAAVIALVLAPAPSLAGGGQTFTVTRNDDPAPNGCQPDDCSLREAILDANAAPGADTITIPAMRITLSIPGAGENAGHTGDLDITDDLTITGVDPDNTIVDGNRLDAVFDIPAPGPGMQSSAIVTIQNIGITGGSASGIHATDELTLDNVVLFSNNNPGDGGAIDSPVGRLNVNNSTIFKNSADGSGGGIGSNSALTIRQSTIYVNFAKAGGGIFATDGLTLENSTVSGNGAQTAGGGGILIVAAPGNLYNSTIAGNSAALAGGGVSNNAATVTMTNTIISGNTGGNAPDCLGAFGGDNNLVKNPANCTLTGSANITGQDPKLFALANNGGLTQTRGIPEDSPALDAGTTTSCQATDQRGVPRPQGSACDIGAFEFMFLGDVDCSGFVALPDFLALLKYVAIGVEPGCLYRGDLDCDNGISGFDLLFLLRHVGHLPEMTRPVTCPAIGPDPPSLSAA